MAKTGPKPKPITERRVEQLITQLRQDEKARVAAVAAQCSLDMSGLVRLVQYLNPSEVSQLRHRELIAESERQRAQVLSLDVGDKAATSRPFQHAYHHLRKAA